MTNFDDLLQVIARNGDPAQLDDLKQFFQEDISSPRLYARIDNFQSLLNALHNRGVVDESNVGALDVIADGLNNRVIRNVINQYVPVPEVEDLPNLYDLEIERDIEENLQRRVQNMHIAEVGNAPQMNDSQLERRRELIRRLISRSVGHKSREFGAAIGISQGEMDQLDVLHPNNIANRVRGMFTLLEEDERINPLRWNDVLCKALIECRRADLEDRVREILARPNF